MNTKAQGDIGVAKAIYYYTAKGYIVSIPNTDNSKYDLLVDKDGIIYRVQVKTTKSKSPYGVYQVQLRTLGGNQSWNGEVSKISSENVDLVFIHAESGDSYEFPAEVLNQRSSQNLGTKSEKYKVALDRW